MKTRVLLVDDSASVRIATSAALKTHGLDVRTARGVADAFATMATWPPDVVVVDATMPREDGSGSTGGTQILLRLRRTMSAVPVIVHSGEPDARTRRSALLAGAFSYVVKGGSVAGLLDAIRSATST